MSGTSVDGIDCALVQCATNSGQTSAGTLDQAPDQTSVEVIATHEHALPPSLCERIRNISEAGPDEIERLGVLDREIGLLFAEAALALLSTSQTSAAEVRAIGSHGQTIRHRPPSSRLDDTPSFTLQIGDPNTIAERTGITTIADFRRRDIAAGGEGAPLAPAFHAAAMATNEIKRAIVNIGGIANASLLDGHTLVQGFDTGPGNTLLDHWVTKHLNQPYDAHGQWAATGKVQEKLLEQLLQHPYFELRGARSTGKEAFNYIWLDEQIPSDTPATPADIQATLAQFTAASISAGIQNSALTVDEVYICGGGAHNTDLLQRLKKILPRATVESTAQIGFDPDWVEAIAFGWLANQCLRRLPGNSPTVTGADGFRVLGGIYPA